MHVYVLYFALVHHRAQGSDGAECLVTNYFFPIPILISTERLKGQEKKSEHEILT